MSESVTLMVNGTPVTMPVGSMVSTAVLMAGVTAFRCSVTGEARSPLCGMGICFECRLTINGQAHSRSCQIPCENGMDVQTGAPDGRWPMADGRWDKEVFFKSAFRRSHSAIKCDVLIIGGGPAGLAAGYCAAQGDQRVCIVDDNLSLGGQIWRGEHISMADFGRRLADLRMPSQTAIRHPPSAIDLISGARVVYEPQPGLLVAEGLDTIYELAYRQLILATGARERVLPFPGWTLPNVMGAGGLQALVKSGLPIGGKRVIVAGSGPLLLAVAAYLRKRGAKVLLIAEQTPWPRLARFGLELLGQPQKLFQAFELKRQLSGVPYLTSCWPVAARGKERVEQVTLRQGRREWSAECDYLAGGFHLVPNLELPLHLGCEVQAGCVRVDEFQETSIPGVYCAGEPTGIGGLELSLVEGQIAGYAAVGRRDEARKLLGTRERLRRWARALNRTFELRPELKSLADSETIVCRCEDVTLERLRGYGSWREAKLQTRCGMGPCQGRVCGAAVEFLLDWRPESTRPPIFPASLESLVQKGA
jgi:NADPH-dependent 2,4-dienoyl-CoA reductase/sulfur reductase-like enzyme